MKATGNGLKEVCVQNLLAIVRGEVPYDRIRGISTGPIDGPVDASADELQQDAQWLIETYEPRATVQGIEVVQDDAAGGSFRVTENIT